ncbi:MAG TPA: glycoside hydrolase family 3 N-terminal domain-containing protein [Phnomibacter sp.]|nr:glycoside hydrolase family 3 N-terminal domain-containing protein [Phnomibacter sp.]
MKRTLLATLGTVVILSLINEAVVAQTKPGSKILPYKNPALPVEKRVDDLLARMTLEEKVFQLCALRLGDGDEVFKSSGVYSTDYVRQQMKLHGVGHISCPTTDMNAGMSVKTANEIQKVAVVETRLGIPTIINDEALHGCRGSGSTSYPQSIALSCTWNLKLMNEISDAIGQETYSRGIRQVLGPVLDLARDPRHGRMEETYGEDPVLAARFGVAYIKGVQANGVICTPKHFLANFVTANGREAANIDLSERALREIHLVPYKAAVTEAHTKSIMAAYNAVNGVPCSANSWLLTDILRKEWKFDGFTVSDWSGVNHSFTYHKVSNSFAESAVLCAKAGMDVDLPRVKSYVQLVQMVKEGKIKEAEIDVNVKRVLSVKFEMGLFEHPYITDTAKATELSDAPAYRNLALKAAEQSIVLLKNDNHILPLQQPKKIAVIGPNANSLRLGGYAAMNVKGATPLEAIRKEFPNAVVQYAKGCDVTGNNAAGFEEALKVAKESDMVLLMMGGEYGKTGGESQDRADLNLMGMQESLIAKMSELGKPVVVVLIDGRPVTMTNWINKVDGVVMMFFAGEEGGNALAKILSGKVNPSGKLTVTIPRTTGQLPMPLLQRPYGRESEIAEYPEMPRTSKSTSAINTSYYPLFPFGYGLSYTTYAYSNLSFSKSTYSMDEPIEVSVDVKNTGNRDGEEIVQLYFTDLNPHAVSTIPMQLRSFQRVTIAAGATEKLKFTLKRSDLEYLNAQLQPELNPGKFEVFVGGSCINGVKGAFQIR